MASRTAVEREDQRMVLHPLAKELRRLVKLRFGSNRAADRALQLPENTTQRVTSQTTQGFDYYNVTRLLTAVGLTPNEAAAFIGLYEADPSPLSAEERILLDLFRSEPRSSRRETILMSLTMMRETWRTIDQEGKVEQEGTSYASL